MLGQNRTYRTCRATAFSNYTFPLQFVAGANAFDRGYVLTTAELSGFVSEDVPRWQYVKIDWIEWYMSTPNNQNDSSLTTGLNNQVYLHSAVNLGGSTAGISVDDMRQRPTYRMRKMTQVNPDKPFMAYKPKLNILEDSGAVIDSGTDQYVTTATASAAQYSGHVVSYTTDTEFVGQKVTFQLYAKVYYTLKGPK